MTWLEMKDEDLKAMLRALSPKLQTALATACAERVYRVWEEHWVGDYSPSVKDTVELGWAYVTDTEVSRGKRKKLLADIRPLVAYLNEDGLTILASAVTVSLRVLESMTDDNQASALALQRALGSALYVAKLAGQISGQGAEESEKEEMDWQEAALARAKTWQQPCDRKMFDGLGETPPKWWVTYHAGKEH